MMMVTGIRSTFSIVVLTIGAQTTAFAPAISYLEFLLRDEIKHGAGCYDGDKTGFFIYVQFNFQFPQNRYYLPQGLDIRFTVA